MVVKVLWKTSGERDMRMTAINGQEYDTASRRVQIPESRKARRPQTSLQGEDGEELSEREAEGEPQWRHWVG